MKKKMLKGALALIMVVGPVVPIGSKLQARTVEHNIQFNWGRHSGTSRDWVQTVNGRRQVRQVRASIVKNNVYRSSPWQDVVAYVDLEGEGSTFRYYDWTF